MITMRIKGGLGNQLFQYAAAYSLSKRLNQSFQFDPALTASMTARAYRLLELNVDIDTVVEKEMLPGKIGRIKNAYINKVCRIFNLSKHKCGDYLYWIETKYEWQPEFFTISASNIYVDGYFQSEDYFKQYRTELLTQFTPKYEPEEEYIQILNEIKKHNAVAVHVRRGDFKNFRNLHNPYLYLLDEEYYQNAVKYMRENLDNPIFFWFSDDMDWVKQHIDSDPNFQFVSIKTKHGDIDDMMLMKNCNHIITANSTFSWWAAWLNENENAIRIVPKKPYCMDGMIPEGWIKI
jgi:hypothetical protein